jgi:hypothetical protein
MKRIKVRCYKALANVYPGVFNHPVYYLTYEGWANYSLSTCINCGELFAIDWENPKTKGLNIHEIAGHDPCPKCKVLLSSSIRDYPNTIKLPDGKIGSYIPDNYIPPDHESLIIEVFELVPNP